MPPIGSNGIKVVKYRSDEVVRGSNKWSHALIWSVYGMNPRIGDDDDWELEC